VPTPEVVLVGVRDLQALAVDAVPLCWRAPRTRGRFCAARI